MLDMFSNKQKYKILAKTGYSGSEQEDEMAAYMQSKPEARSLVQRLERKAKSMQGSPTVAPDNKQLGMAQGGSVPNQTTIGGQPHRLAYVNPQEEEMMKAAGGAGIPSYGGIPAYVQVVNPGSASGAQITVANDQATDTENTVGGMTGVASVAAPNYAYVTPTTDQEIQVGPDQEATTAGFETIGTASQATSPTKATVSTVDPTTAAADVKKVTDATQAQQGIVSQQSQVDAAQQNESAVSGLQAAQGAAVMMSNPVQREIQAGELITGAADAAKAAAFNEQVQAATATPSDKATVKGQLEGLMQDFEGGETPAWAAGAMRNAAAVMASRGLGASSMAGQALIQAAMESALPIAQSDAATIAKFESQNLSNNQQRAMLAAQQRAQFMGQEFDQAFQSRVANASKISDIANMNFTAEQQVALENSRAANTMALNNLSNDQAMVMAEASALSNLDMANLNNRQQAAVQNAQSFLGMEMSNLNNKQQTEMFRAQQNVQALFTDQAAENAAAQFNSASENQTNQFFSDLQANVSKFNADQNNAIAQFDTSAENSTYQFNVSQDNAFKQFMISNSLVVAQANAKWRQTAALTNQASANERALYVAKEQNALTQAEIDEVWQRERDEMDYVFTAYQSDKDRANALIEAKLASDSTLDAAKLQAEIKANSEIGNTFLDWLFDEE
tara:strand:+ start:593 stop:2623 length:2031 start_codon:yes stop_codon:yes gene_type:complete